MFTTFERLWDLKQIESGLTGCSAQWAWQMYQAEDIWGWFGSNFCMCVVCVKRLLWRPRKDIMSQSKFVADFRHKECPAFVQFTGMFLFLYIYLMYWQHDRTLMYQSWLQASRHVGPRFWYGMMLTFLWRGMPLLERIRLASTSLWQTVFQRAFPGSHTHWSMAPTSLSQLPSLCLRGACGQMTRMASLECSPAGLIALLRGGPRYAYFLCHNL